MIRNPPIAVQVWGVQRCSSRDRISDSRPEACVLCGHAWCAVRIHAHAAVKYQVEVWSHSPGAIIPHITALHTQGPRCSDYRAETYNSIRPSFLPSPPLFRVSSLGECVRTHVCLQRLRSASGGLASIPSKEISDLAATGLETWVLISSLRIENLFTKHI